MKIVFGTENTLLFLLLCLILATGVTLLVYFRSKEIRELSQWQHRVLIALRFLSFFLISMLILAPFIKTLKHKIQSPVIIAAFDNSQSMASSADSVRTMAQLRSFETQIQQELGTQFTVEKYIFGEKVTPEGILTLNDKKSDYSKLIDAVYSNHFNENIGAMILVGDGIYNVGANPVSEVQKLSFPVYTIGMGDTTTVADAAIAELKTNRTAFSGNEFPVELGLKFDKMPNIPVTVNITHGAQEIYSQKIVPAGDDFFTTQGLKIKAETAGLQHYTVEISSPVFEKNKENNIYRFVVNVLESKQKVLILSEGLHPDIGALKNTLELLQNYEVTVASKEPYPSNMSDFNLIILNQMPSGSPAGGQVLAKAIESKVPLLFIVGRQTYLAQLNQYRLGGEIIQQAQNPVESQPVFNPDFNFYKTNDELAELIDRFPPLQAPFAEISLDPSFSILLYQRLNNIKTPRPLLVMGNFNGRKTGFIYGEGIWRWRLYNYWLTENHNHFSELIGSMVQYLSLRENEDNFIISGQPVFYETDPVILRAEVYNESYSPDNSQEVAITFTNLNQENFQFVFEKDGSFYKLDAGKLPAGNYTYDSKIKIGNEEYPESGEFAVLPLNIEKTVTTANHNILYQVSKNTGGEFFTPEEAGRLIEKIKENNRIKPISYTEAAINELMNLKWLFFVLLFLASMEWFLRKFWGIY